MIELYSLVWVVAVFMAIVGFLRGWNREILATAGIMLAAFALFQFDSLLRGTILLTAPREQTFLIQFIIFLIVVYFSYRQGSGTSADRERQGTQSSILGALMGAVNGYLIMGMVWYYLDINAYPLDPLIIAPEIGSPSAESIAIIPMLVFSGGITGNGDFMTVIVIVLLLLVIFIA